LRNITRAPIADKLRLLGASGLIGLVVGLPILWVLGFSSPFLIVQPIAVGVFAGTGIMCFRVFFPIHSAQIASAAAVCGGVFIVVAMLFSIPRVVGFLLPSILIVDVAVGILTWQLRTRLGLEVFFEPRQ
jgi:hypothetical protein